MKPESDREENVEMVQLETECDDEDNRASSWKKNLI